MNIVCVDDEPVVLGLVVSMCEGYIDPFATDPRELHLVGCVFDSRARQLSDWQVR